MNVIQREIEICFSPAIYAHHHNPDNVVVVVDILRATSAICAAFMNGVKTIIPVGSIDEALEYKKKGFMVAAERDGLVLEFADFGNSPFNFITDKVRGQTIVYSTTNGTHAIQMASSCFHVVVGSYLNLSALAGWLVEQDHNVLILCSGWKGKFSLEDSLFAGALSEKLLGSGRFGTNCDSVNGMVDLWRIAKNDLLNYVLKTAQKKRLAKHGLDDVIDYCHTPDQTLIVPVLNDKILVPELGNPIGQ